MRYIILIFVFGFLFSCKNEVNVIEYCSSNNVDYIFNSTNIYRANNDILYSEFVGLVVTELIDEDIKDSIDRIKVYSDEINEYIKEIINLIIYTTCDCQGVIVDEKYKYKVDLSMIPNIYSQELQNEFFEDGNLAYKFKEKLITYRTKIAELIHKPRINKSRDYYMDHSRIIKNFNCDNSDEYILCSFLEIISINDSYIKNNEIVSWEEYHFKDKNTQDILTTLILLQNSIATGENLILNDWWASVGVCKKNEFNEKRKTSP